MKLETTRTTPVKAWESKTKTLHKFFKIFFLFVLAIWLFCPNTCFSFDNSALFKIYCENPKLEKQIEQVADSSYVELSDFFGDSLAFPVSIFVTQNDRQFDSLVGENFPDWGVGAAIPSQYLIVVKSPTKHNYLKSIPEVLTHELAHIFLGNKVNRQDLPRWLDEGFAMYIAQEQRWDVALSIAKAVFTNSLVNLTEIDSVNSFNSPKANLAYLESYLAVSYFIQTYGKDGFKELIRNLANNENINSALVKTIGLDYQGFSDEFTQYLKKKYNWTSFFSDNLFLWLILAFLIVMFYFVKKSRTRKIVKSWEEEDNWQKRE